ncbi:MULTISPECIES: tetratricopeptide repeat protein [unclassified Pseudoalteromonas]|uniref:tetratricopeptide repeat protein n=1 Tax=unclassified Pseudoalteromonas TaxID=194690 RepID=UPI0005A658EA|nr:MULTISPECIES: tetratricopeptide repeat protein [unclassified Pseudoalteromonas]
MTSFSHIFQKISVIVFISLLLCFSTNASQLSIEEKITNLSQVKDNNLLIEEIKKLLASSKITKKQTVKLLNIKARTFHAMGNFPLAVTTLKQAEAFSSLNNMRKSAANVSINLGIIFYMKGEHLRALEAYKQGEAFYKDANTPLRYANLLSNIGLVYAAKGDISEAIKKYEQAETIYQKDGTEVDQVDIRHNIAGLYLRLNRFDIAIEMLVNVISSREQNKDKKGLALAYGDIGVAYKHSKQYELAKTYLFKSLRFYQQEKDLYNSASQLHNISELYNKLGEIDKALNYAKQAVDLSLIQDHKSAYAGSLYSYSKALFYKNQIDEAFKALNQSTKIAEEIDYQAQLRSNLALLSLIKAAQGNTVSALKNHYLYVEENNKVSNAALNEEFARFEAQKLKQQVTQLEQSKKLQQLEMKQETQKRNFIIIAILLIVLVLFFIFRRNMERNSKLTLEVQVKQRTHELECLMQELKQADNVKSQFLANMSHEIRTPLTAVIGQAEAIVSGDVEEEFICKEVSIIHNNSLHLLDLINDILDLSKIEANKLELELQNQDLHTILEELNNIFTQQAKTKGLIFEITHSLNAPFIINIDSFRLKQILINLCSNAIKFTSNGSVLLEVAVINNELSFKVTDTGIGMDDIQLERLFESFTQGDTSISRRFGGTGLGLCLSEQLAKIMDGEISVQSEINKGSTFTLFLPFSHLNDDALIPDKPAYADEIDLNKVFSGQVLLAEDHDDNRRLIARILTSLGLEVLSAKNGKEAVELFLQHDPVLILLDIQMPEMDGIEAFTLLRQCGCSQPIIALTANAMSHEIEQYLSIGFDGHLKKPIERAIFIQLIAQYCQSQSALNEAYQALDMLDMTDLVEEFKNSLNKEKSNLVQSIEKNNISKIEQQAHSLAGAAQMFGFKNLAKIAKELESQLKNYDMDKIGVYADNLLNELNIILLKAN